MQQQAYSVLIKQSLSQDQIYSTHILYITPPLKFHISCLLNQQRNVRWTAQLVTRLKAADAALWVRIHTCHANKTAKYSDLVFKQRTFCIFNKNCKYRSSSHYTSFGDVITYVSRYERKVPIRAYRNKNCKTR